MTIVRDMADEEMLKRVDELIDTVGWLDSICLENNVRDNKCKMGDGTPCPFEMNKDYCNLDIIYDSLNKIRNNINGIVSERNVDNE